MRDNKQNDDLEATFDEASFHTSVSYVALLRNLEEGFPGAFEAINNWVALGEPTIAVEGLRETTRVVEPTIIDFLQQNKWLAPDGKRPRDEVYHALSHQIPGALPDLHIKQP